jgi:lipopolysaccharide/colanic/teichoic acid biosynthesis glycosyltransferase
MIAASFKHFPQQTGRLSWVHYFHPERIWFKGQTYTWLKRCFDLTLCLLCLPLLLPVFLACALLIAIESPGGPILFAQERTGKNGKRFRMYKFRTMVPNAEELKRQLLHMNELHWPDFKITNDPRITRVGKILRRTSLDELPQLINVLKGEMSLVGPRPTSFDTSTYQLWQTERLDVFPGLTGLWQIYGRGKTEFDERLRLDILYIQRRCLMLDLAILLRTVGAVAVQRGAH